MIIIATLVACIVGLAAGIALMLWYDAAERARDIRAQEAAKAAAEREWADRDAQAAAYCRWAASQYKGGVR